MNHDPMLHPESRARWLQAAILYVCPLGLVAALATSCSRGEPGPPDLPQQPDQWVTSIALDADSKARHVGQTKDYLITEVTGVEAVNGLRSVSVGDDIAGVRIGAIRCSFHGRDASYGGDQYMWRGRWACLAGRSKEEVETAVAEDGTKRFDYIHAAPIRMQAE